MEFIALFITLFSSILALTHASTPFSRIGIIGEVLLAFVIADGLLIFFDYSALYKPIENGRMKELEKRAAVLGVLQLFIGGLIPGILVLYVWSMIGDLN